jgi:D-alanyl-D-alanine dipeptidase
VRAVAWLLGAATGLGLGCAPHSTAQDPGFVDLAEVAPEIDVEMRYAGSDNFVGEPIDGYAAARCLLTRPAAQALAAAQRELESRGMGLRVYDCYRPQRAVDHFARWAGGPPDPQTRARVHPSIEKERLFEAGYIARRSGHSRGSTVDLTLLERDARGALRAVDMGTPFDFFDPASHTGSPAVAETQRAHRLLLRELMERAGFENLPEEWWHFTLRDEPWPDRYWDVEIR